jgi:hypothetical protein
MLAATPGASAQDNVPQRPSKYKGWRRALHNRAGPSIFLDPDPSTVRLARINLGVLDWSARNATPGMQPSCSVANMRSVSLVAS